jgi:hypothetical protein
VLSGRGLCDEVTTRPEESYRLWYVVECDLAHCGAFAPKTNKHSPSNAGRLTSNNPCTR